MVVRSLCDGWLAASLLTCVALSACSGDDDDGSDPASEDGGRSGPADGAAPRLDAGDAGAADAGPDAGAFDCKLKLASGIVAISDPLAQSLQPPTFVWSGDGVVGVWPRFEGTGYRLVELDGSGAVAVPARTLWPEDAAINDPSVAVREDVVAIADRRTVGINNRGICRIALVTRDDGPVITPPKRLSDVPDDELGSDEAADCQVVAVAEGFLVVWYQLVDAGAPSWTLFAQAVAPDGSLQGERLSLGSSSEMRPHAPLIRSDGSLALIVRQQRVDQLATFSYVADGEVETLELELGSPPMLLDYAHGNFLVRTVDHLILIDERGKPVRSPIAIGLRARFAPLGDGYASISQEEFVVAAAYDAELQPRAAPVTLSNNRAAIADSLVYAPDGESTAAIVLDFSQLLYVPLACE